MGEPWVDVKDNIVCGSGFLRLLPTTASDMKITALGTAFDLLQVTDENTKYPDFTPKLEEITKELSTGVVVKMPFATTFVSALDGYKTGESREYSFEIKAVMSKAKWSSIRSNLANPFFALKGRGYDVQWNHLGWQIILGYVKGLDLPLKKEFVEVTLSVVGGFKHTTDTGITYTAVNTALATPSTVTAVGKNALTVPSGLLTADTFVDLLNGKIVDVEPS